MYTFDQLKVLKLSQLQDIGNELDIPKWRYLRKIPLIEAIWKEPLGAVTSLPPPSQSRVLVEVVHQKKK